MGQILNPEQEIFIELISNESSLTKLFYLTGGTVLAAYYLHHRKSEDLDFFSKKEFELLAINSFLRKIKKKLGIGKIDFQQTFNRNIYFLYLSSTKTPLKVEFTYFPFEQIDNGKKIRTLLLDSILDIAVNKAFTISQRPRSRDFIDLFFIFKKFPKLNFEDLLKKARAKFDWHIDHINLGTQLLKVKNLKDYPIMLIDYDYQKVEEFFLREAKKLKTRIFKS